MNVAIPSLCRICTHGCGIVAEVSDGRVVSVKGDRDNPLYGGYSCVKGRAQPAFLYHPERLLKSKFRQPDGRFQDIALTDAVTFTADRLSRILDRYGPTAIATYMGTNQVVNWRSRLMFLAFMDAIGSPSRFAPETIDKPGKSIALAHFGTWQAPAKGFYKPEAILFIGVNPLITYTGFPAGQHGKWLSERLGAGASLIVIDPRRSDLAKRATLFIQPRPGNDVAILAAMIRVIIAEDLYDKAFVDEEVDGFDALRRAVDRFLPERVASLAGIEAADIFTAARDFAAASDGYAFSGTGPSMAGHSTLVEYLILCLETLCGNWQREGDIVQQPGALVAQRQWRAQAVPPSANRGFGEAMRVRGLRVSASGRPTASLADEILLQGRGQIRALLSFAGNPAVAFPNSPKVLQALNELDLLVQFDPWMSETAKRAHLVVAPKMPLEISQASFFHDSLSLFGKGYGPGRPFAMHSPAVVDPPESSEVVEEWEFIYLLAQRMGLQLTLAPTPSMLMPCDLDMQTMPTGDDLDALLARDARVSLDEIRQHRHGRIFDDALPTVQAKDPGWTGRLAIGDNAMLADLAAFALDGPTPSTKFSQFRLVCRRVMHRYNSTGGNVPKAIRAKPYNPAFMNPEDMKNLGIIDGDVVEITSSQGSILALAEAEAELRRGVVSMAFGYGSASPSANDFSDRGSNVNWLIPDDTDFERHSGQPRMSNLAVVIRKH
jgi:Anaerobic dehydrogenases, typically selenocysteine-containing